MLLCSSDVNSGVTDADHEPLMACTDSVAAESGAPIAGANTASTHAAAAATRTMVTTDVAAKVVGCCETNPSHAIAPVVT